MPEHLNGDNTAQEPSVDTMRNRLGASGHFGNIARLQTGIDPDMVAMVNHVGGVIGRTRGENGENLFALRFGQDQSAQDFTGNLKEMKAHLARLHRPVFTAIDQAVRADTKKGVAAKVQEERETTLSLLRYMTTGSPVLPEYQEVDGVEDHSEVEHNIHIANMWRETPEIAQMAERQKHGIEPAIIPETTFDPARGIVLKIHPSFMNAASQQEEQGARETLARGIMQNLRAATNNRYGADTPDELSLTLDEITKFCENAHLEMKSPDFISQLAQAKIETRAGEAIARIDVTVSLLSSPLNQAHIAQAAIPKPALQAMSMATSALSPIIASEAMQARYAHYFYTERKNPPMQNIVQDMNVLQEVLTHYTNSDKTTQAHIEAIASDPEFYGLLSFEKEMSRTLAQAIKDPELAQGYEMLQHQIEAAIPGGMPLSAEHLDDDQKDIIDLLERSYGIGDGGMGRIGKEFVGNSVDFFKDIYTFPFLSKKHFAATCAVLGWIAYTRYGGDAASAQAAVSTIADQFALGAQDTGMIIPGFEDSAGPNINNIDFSVLEDEAKRSLLTDEQCQAMPTYCHLNDSILGPYKHFTIDKAVVGTSQTLMSLMQTLVQTPMHALGIETNPAPSFMDAAMKSIKETGDVAFKANIFQNVAGHMAMAASLFVMAAQSGVRSVGRIFGFFEGFFNAAMSTVKDRPLMLPAAAATLLLQPQNYLIAPDVQTGLAFEFLAAAAGYALYERKGKSFKGMQELLSENATTLTQHLDEKTPEWRMHDPREEIIQSLAQAGLLKAELEAQLPENIKDADMSLRGSLGMAQRGLSSAFTIGTKNLKPVLAALDQFDIALDIASRYMNDENRVYQSFMHNKIKSCSDALREYRDGGLGVDALQATLQDHLRDVVAAQTYLGGQSEIYTHLYEANAPEKDLRRLYNHGRKQFGEKERDMTLARYRENIEKLRSEGSHLTAYHNRPDLSLRNDALSRAGAQAAYSIEKGELALKTAWEYAKQGRNRVWDKIVLAAQSVHDHAQDIPYKKQTALVVGAAGLGLVGADLAGYGNGVVETLSSGYGLAVGAAVTTGVFLMVNIPDDLIVAHAGMGGPSYAAGAGVYVGRKFLAQPAYGYIMEKIRDVRASLQDEQQNSKIVVSQEDTAVLEENVAACASCMKRASCKTYQEVVEEDDDLVCGLYIAEIDNAPHDRAPI